MPVDPALAGKVDVLAGKIISGGIFQVNDKIIIKIQQADQITLRSYHRRLLPVWIECLRSVA